MGAAVALESAMYVLHCAAQYSYSRSRYSIVPSTASMLQLAGPRLTYEYEYVEFIDTILRYEYYLQDLEEQKRTKYKINGTATTAIGTSTRTRTARGRDYSYTVRVQTKLNLRTCTVRVLVPSIPCRPADLLITVRVSHTQHIATLSLP